MPDAWEVKSAEVLNSRGNDVLQFKESNLKILQYSEPLDVSVSKPELERYIFHTEAGSEAIPYLTSYYKKNSGVCMSGKEFYALEDDVYRIKIESSKSPGTMKLLETVIPGRSDSEIVFWSYVCHPSMANNELSGPVVARALAGWLQERPSYFTYRFIWSVETIGAIAYLHQNYERLQENTRAGFVLNCLGGPGTHSFVLTPSESTWPDHFVKRLALASKGTVKSLPFTQRDSDERQFAGGRAKLPFLGLSKTKPASYREYHTSLDNLDFVSQSELEDSLKLLQNLVDLIEEPLERVFPRAAELGEPFLTDLLAYPSISGAPRSGFDLDLRIVMDILSYSDGALSLAQIASICDFTPDEGERVALKLQELGLLVLNHFDSSHR